MLNILLSISLLFGDVSTENISKSTVKTVYTVTTKKCYITHCETQTLSYYGSGTVIKQENGCSYIISCSHTLPGIGTLNIQTWDGKLYSGEILFKDVDYDLSILKINTPINACAVQLGDNETYGIETIIYKSGYPKGLKNIVAHGYCANQLMRANGSPLLSFAGMPDAISGDSGGGVHRASDGRLIGVIWGGDTGIGFRGRTLPDIRAFFKKNNFNP